MNAPGLVIEDILESSRVRVLPWSSAIALEAQKSCPSCESPLEPLCLLINRTQDQQLRFGLCSRCGYMGYIDRPSQSWMREFYSGQWDTHYSKTVDEVRNPAPLPRKGTKASRYLAVALAEKLGVRKDRAVCEIGCGYGETLLEFDRLGFSRLIGTEHSRHRAELVHEAFGYETLHGAFESDEVLSRLRSHAPVGLLFSHHVLEHTYHPADVIAKASSLQAEGDSFILSLPNGEGEHINYALLLLVHLHSFTKESLELLLNKHGYEVVADESPDPTNLIFGLRKSGAPRAHFKRRTDYRERAIRRIKQGLQTDSVAGPGLSKLEWEQRTDMIDTARVLPGHSNAALERAAWAARRGAALLKTRVLRRFTANYTMLVRPLERRLTSPESSVFELQFGDSLQVLVK